MPDSRVAAARRLLPQPYELWPHPDWAAVHMKRGDVVAATAKPLNHLIPAYGMSLVSPAWPDPALAGREAAARWSALRTVFAPTAAPRSRLQALARYDVRWILATPAQAKTFDRLPGVGEVEHGPQGTVLFRVETGRRG
ncbi:hypothetical protein [Streptomyces longispororuber]|uniref:hypothetical protein n=1 Tax=Streptomyces longispororuber TaxID=68230 RepID=UPI00210DC4C3|nr:hypothetical protein [Streptomyces longispororuber]MCQ4210557.1 hypothetical protein [Streptomyces longispororuber]